MKKNLGVKERLSILEVNWQREGVQASGNRYNKTIVDLKVKDFSCASDRQPVSICLQNNNQVAAPTLQANRKPSYPARLAWNEDKKDQWVLEIDKINESIPRSI